MHSEIKKSFLVYHDWFENQLLDFSDDEIGQVIRALYRFDSYGEITDDAEFADRAVRNAYKSCLAITKANRENYERKCAVNRESASKGGQAKAAKRYRSLKNANDTDTETDTETGTETDTEKKRSNHFNSFEQRVYDYKSLEQQLLSK